MSLGAYRELFDDIAGKGEFLLVGGVTMALAGFVMARSAMRDDNVDSGG